MPTNVISAPSSVSAKYWAELKDLSDNVKLELITLLSSSMTRTEKDIKKDASEKIIAMRREQLMQGEMDYFFGQLKAVGITPTELQEKYQEYLKH